MSRKRLFEIIEVSEPNDRPSAIYDAFMMLVIIASLVPLAFKDSTPVLNVIDHVCVCVFIVDYILRLFTADYKLNRGVASFFLYPFTFLAIIDLVCILPSFAVLANGFRVLKIFRLLLTFRILRAAKMLRYSKSLLILTDVIQEQRDALLAVLALAIAYILVSALVIFNVEPDTFHSFFEAIYWAAVSLTTVGYGDICATSTAGRVITILSAFFGIAIIALPSGILTAGYIEKLRRNEASEA